MGPKWCSRDARNCCRRTQGGCPLRLLHGATHTACYHASPELGSRGSGIHTCRRSATLRTSGTLPEIVLEAACGPSGPCVPASAAALGTRLAAQQPSGSVGRTVPEDSVGTPASALAQYRLAFVFHEGKVVRGDIHQFRRGRIGPRIGTVVQQARGSVRVGLIGESRPTFPCAPPPELTGLLRPIRSAGRQADVAEVPASHPYWRRLTVWSWPVLVYPEPWQKSRTSVLWHETHGDITE